MIHLVAVRLAHCTLEVALSCGRLLSLEEEESPREMMDSGHACFGLRGELVRIASKFLIDLALKLLELFF